MTNIPVHSDLLELMVDRCSSYAFLSRMYREEITSTLLSELVESKALEMQANLVGVEVFGEFIGKLEGADIERAATDLAAEYASLFLNAGNHPVFPYESVYTSPERLLMQKARDEVLKEYRQQGLNMPKKFNEPADHLAVELEFMSFLCQKTIKMLQNDDREEGIAYLQKQKEFLEQHLLAWCPRFCKDLEAASESDFYRGIALLTDSFLCSEPGTLCALVDQLAPAK